LGSTRFNCLICLYRLPFCLYDQALKCGIALGAFICIICKRSIGLQNNPQSFFQGEKSVANAGTNVAAKKNNAGFVAAHSDHTLGARPQDGFEVPVDNSNAPFKTNAATWEGHVVSLMMATTPSTCWPVTH
jgi:hypothetical protein